MAFNVPLLLLAISQLFLDFIPFSSAADSITQSQSLAVGSTLVSKNGTFELGFFPLGTSPNRYLGIWYKNIPNQTIVWVANRRNPVTTANCSVSISREGNLLIRSHNESDIWLAIPTKMAINPILQLLDSGNLVLREENDENPENYLWQSFDHPTDTLIPGMKLGWSRKIGLHDLSAWKNSQDPSPGDFTWGFEDSKYPELVMWKGSEKIYRDSPLDLSGFTGSSQLIRNPLFGFEFVNEEYEIYFRFVLRAESQSQIVRLTLDRITYTRQLYAWVEEEKTWNIISSVPRDSCDNYNTCGPNGKCGNRMNQTEPLCQCLSGFKPKSPWNWAEGCIRSLSWSCKEKNRDDFVQLTGIEVPDTTNSLVLGSLTLDQCRALCWDNCSCTAFANFEGTRGCIVWFGDLNDVKQIEDADDDLYVRLDPSEIGVKDDHKRKVAVTSITITVPLILLMLCTLSYIYWRRRQLRDKNNDEGEQDFELPLFDLESIAHATNNFSSDNKLGQGGFGPVYKGELAGGQEISVKRLSKRSEQGSEEFKNEVKLCAKLQHRNLVKVLGCCSQKDEKLLIYEYMHNKSLDWFLFDSTRSKLLDWSQRFHIIYGIARGLIYLHQDSRLRIIHRDLKASNILLDKELNPKISDFGLARMFGGDEIEGNTRKVAGTFGYMAPEYVIDGLFSIKSDIFSFGILLLEIVSGKKNKGLSYANHGLTLIGHAWRLWKEDVPLELLDPCLKDSCVVSEVLRCIHIGLLCVQQHPHDRPNMASVVVMLNNESTFPLPKEPGFFLGKTSAEDPLSSGMQKPFSNNEITLSLLDPR